MPSESVQCCVTSPPYWGLRDYGVSGQLGLEKTPAEFVSRLVDVFREVKRVLRADGTLWLNLGDSYAGAGRGGIGEKSTLQGGQKKQNESRRTFRRDKADCFPIVKREHGLKSKDLVGIPWTVAFALRGDGWYLRSDIIWHKPNPMPESVTDRPTKSHEYLFLLTKSESYFYDNKAIQEAAKYHGPNGAVKSPYGRGFARSGNKYRKPRPSSETINRGAQAGGIPWDGAPTRQRRSVWSVTTKPFKGAHFATFPPDLIEPCIKAGSRPGDTVLDPFFGAGTTGLVAQNLARDWVGIELNPTYCELARERIGLDACVVGPMA